MTISMKSSFLIAILSALACGLPRAQEPVNKPVYQDLARSFEVRATDLVAHMTLEEKVAQMMNAAPAIERLGIPAYEWWNEALHGVARAGAATVFPQAIGMGATFNPALVREVATVISDEARAKHHEFASRGLRNRYQGLTFWSPNINIFRDPRWGRGQETYGEDPYLTSLMGVEFVKGLQGEGDVRAGKYRKLDATAKHFAVHSGPESSRHYFDVRPSERDLYETYLPAFRALVQEGKVASVMGAYNRVNGESASASPRLLQDILRKDWGFKGYVVSDCDSIDDIFRFHKIVKSAEEAAVLGVKNGLEMNCGRTYEALVAAVKQGLISEAEIDDALGRLMLTRFQLGMFDPAVQVPWTQIPYAVNQAPAQDALAHRAAQESMVLLKNDGILPLSPTLKSIAVIGPTADEVMSLLGNYYGTPKAPVTILAGIRAAVSPRTQVTYAMGAELVEGRSEPRAAPVIEPQYLRPAAGAQEQGLSASYFRGMALEGKPVLSRIDRRIAFRWDRGAPTDDLVARGELDPASALSGDEFSVRWAGQLLPPVSGDYEINLGANDGVRLYIDNRLVIDTWAQTERLENHLAKIKLAADKAYDIRLEYFENTRDAEVRLAWRLPGALTPFEEALAAAEKAEVIIFVGGLTGDVEGEEMKVSYPGFDGGDRTDMRLPASQQRLLEALKATGKPVVLVLTSGSALAIDWAQQQLPGILLAWYPGQRGGDAVADTLFGKYNPAGRLPVTFYKAAQKLPAFDDYSMRERTYRYFSGEPLYPFGHGLSYTQFRYAKLALSARHLREDDPVTVSLIVKNTGKRAGDEVVQLYVKPLDPKRPRALKELRGLARVHLAAGQSKRVKFTLVPNRDMTYYSETAKAYQVDGGSYELQLGASSRAIHLHAVIAVDDRSEQD
jgi:beta-glucosidase